VPGKALRVLGVGNARSVIFLRWAWRLARRGHEVHLVSDRITDRPEERHGYVFHDLRRLEPLTRVPGLRRFRFAPALGTLGRELEVDLVHGHFLLPYGYWAAASGARPLVMSPWGTDILIAAQQPGRGREWARKAIGAADYLVVNSLANERASVALGADRERIRRIIWYAELEKFGPERADPGLRARLGWPDDAVIVLSLRYFRPDTNIDVVVRAFRRVADEEPKARLVLAARTGPLREEIERLVDVLDLRPLVEFYAASEDELPVLVASSDVLVQMTESDSTPASLLEGMASELPVACGVAPSLDEWVAQGDGAEVVPPRDEDALVAALLELVRDPELRRRYGQRNGRFIREWFTDPGVELERVYDEVLAASG
jgi:glycosyltransferase involved in cell wall biosynthesis